MGVSSLRAQLEKGEVSSRELVAQALERIEATQPTLNAFRRVRAEAALAEADAADARLRAGERGPLLGIPVAIKDDIDIAGEPTAFGCEGEFEPKADDCETVRRVKLAGAVIVGKTNTPELGQWPITEGPAFGATRNPWNLDHTPGGSSGGSAAAVAAGVVPVALGSDGLGSIRVPAAWTNLVGIKPQRGRISTWPDAVAFNGLAVIGPLARTVADAAALLDAASGPAADDRHPPPAPAEPYAAAAAREPGRLRIALSLKAPYAVFRTPLHPEVADAVRRLAQSLAGLGHDVEPADPSYGVLGVGVFSRSLGGVTDWLKRLPARDRLDPRTLEAERVGRLLGAAPVLAGARALERPMARQVGAIFRRYDVVLTPTNAQPPPLVGAWDGLSGWATDQAMLKACPYTWPWNVLGWPAVAVPAGFTGDGLPLGAQLLGPANSEPLLLSLAAQLEDAERWHERRPAAAASQA
jgi:amidase